MCYPGQVGAIQLSVLVNQKIKKEMLVSLKLFHTKAKGGVNITGDITDANPGWTL